MLKRWPIKYTMWEISVLEDPMTNRRCHCLYYYVPSGAKSFLGNISAAVL